ncbi:MAG: FAD-binding oxidoreductase [Deltaproteobacteria bacterium]|nr:FAD-binding oxidoreductase [Deltaproteobacteria bacterium]
MKKKEPFYPDWYEGIPSATSYRAILKWGAINRFKHPNLRLYALIKETFDMTDDDFRIPYKMGLEEVSIQVPPTLSPESLDTFRKIAGAENVKTDGFSRLRAAYGKTTYDTFRLREGIAENLPDAVISPRDKTDITEIVRFCDSERIPVYVLGGGSSVTRGFECMRGGITLDMRTHMRRILKLSEENHTVTVEPGVFGPDLEDALNSAPKKFGARRAYTCGHFPQSFEHSSVGGWVVTRGAGQNSTYYGKIEDMVVCQEYVTPVGTIKTGEYPASATGPSIDQIMLGSEGAYGVLVAVTLKIFRYDPSNTRRFSFIFRTWDDAIGATREILQGECGRPSVFRLSDPEETDIAMKLYGVEGTPIDTALKLRGYKAGEKCLLLGTADGDRDFARLVKRNVQKICKRYGAMYTTGFAARKWEEGRFTDPYMREDLQDFGIVIDTLECAVSWEQIRDVHARVREYCKSRPRTICMSHCSHFYPQGANLYFIFIGRMKMKEFVEYHRGVLDAIQRSGAAISHHHGIGKLFAPWLEGQIGKNQLDVFRALKRHFDPRNIMNPGGTLALDLPDSEKRTTKA